MKNNEERFHTQKLEKQKYSKLINYMGIKQKKKKKKKTNKLSSFDPKSMSLHRVILIHK